MARETIGPFAYLVDQKGAYLTADLIERAEIIFSERVRKELSEAAIQDVRQAGKALVLELPTAAGFHMLRATESVIRAYYKAVVGKLPKSRNWGVYVKDLKAKGADAKVVGVIDQLRELHRNPLMHPEETLSEDEAIVIFGLAQSVIVAMVGDIVRRTSKPTAPLPAVIRAALPTGP